MESFDTARLTGSAAALAGKNFPTSDERITPELIDALGVAMSNRSPNTSSAKDSFSLPAGYTYLGQFIDHDLSYFTDENEPFNGPGTLTQRISPHLDLLGLYGKGDSVALDPHARGRITLVDLNLNCAGIRAWDICRGEHGAPLIGDCRNDENFILSQLQALFIRLHNAVADEAERMLGSTATGEDIFSITKQHVLAFYFRVIRHDFLKRLLFDEVWEGYFGAPKVQWQHWQLFDDEDLLKPNVFNLAAYRFGHALVRPFYSLNRCSSMLQEELFKYREQGAYFNSAQHIPADDAIDWRLFFFNNPDEFRFAQVAMAIRTAVPLKIPTIPEPLNRLAVRNLRRGFDQRLPSIQCLLSQARAQTVLANLAQPNGILCNENLDDDYFVHIPNGEVLNTHTPPWYFVLREGQEMWQSNLRNRGVLGPIASVLIASFFKLTLEKSGANHIVLNEKFNVDSISDMSAIVRYITNREGQ